MISNEIFVFWDLSNIYIPAQQVAASHERYANLHALRIHFETLLDLVRAGRRIRHAVAVGSRPNELHGVAKRLEEMGVKLELSERGRLSGKEQGVDQSLQVHLLRAGYDHPPSVAVLLTGDGRGYDDGIGFHADLERLYQKGWGIEVVTWDIACSKRLKEWASQVGEFIKLENYYSNVTFIEGARRQEPLRHVQRGVADPRRVPDAWSRGASADGTNGESI